METKLKELSATISSLPNMTQEDIKKIMSNINWIASGDRDKYYEREALLKEFKAWGSEFASVLRKKYDISHKNTNYSTWEYGNNFFSIDIYYTFPRGRGDFKVNSKEDFAVLVTNWKLGKPVNLGTFKTPEEVINVLIENNLYQLKEKV